MALIVTSKQPWRRQPSQPASVDWNNPLAEDLQIASCANFTQTQGRLFAAPSASAISYGSCAIGEGYRSTGASGQYVRWDTSYTIEGTSECTYECFLIGSSFPSLAALGGLSTGSFTNGILNNTPDSAYYGKLRSILAFNGASNPYNIHGWYSNIDIASGIAFQINTPQHIVITKAAGASSVTINIYRNGALIYTTTSNNSTTNFQISGPYFYLFGRHYSGSATITGVIVKSALYSRVLSAGEVAELAINPWQVYAPIRRIIYSLGSTALSGSLDAILQQSLTATASLSAGIQSQLAVTAAADAVLSQAQSATVSADSALEQAASLAADLDAALQSVAALTATLDSSLTAGGANIASSIDGALQQAGAVAASADGALQKSQSIAVTPDAALQAGATLSASADAALQAQASVAAQLDSALSRAVSLTASLDGYLTTPGGSSIAALLDAALLQASGLTTALNAGLSVAQNVSTGFGSVLAQANLLAASLTGLLQKLTTLQGTLDAVLSSPASGNTALQAALRQAFSLSGMLDAYIRATADTVVSLDAALTTAGLVGGTALDAFLASRAPGAMQAKISIFAAMGGRVHLGPH